MAVTADTLMDALVSAKGTIRGFGNDKTKEYADDIDRLNKTRSESEAFKEKTVRLAALIMAEMTEESKSLPSIKRIKQALDELNTRG